MVERFSPEQLQRIEYFFPDADIPEEDGRLLAILEVAVNRALLVPVMELLIKEALPAWKVRIKRPTVSSLLWYLGDAMPTPRTHTAVTRVHTYINPAQEAPAASGIIARPDHSIQVLSLQDPTSKAPRGIIFSKVEERNNEFRKPKLFTHGSPALNYS